MTPPHGHLVTALGSAGALGTSVLAVAADVPGSSWLAVLGLIASAAVPLAVAMVNRTKDARLEAERVTNAELRTEIRLLRERMAETVAREPPPGVRVVDQPQELRERMTETLAREPGPQG